MREAIRAKVTTLGMTDMNLPVLPATKSMGRKAAMVVTTVATTGPKTCCVPKTAASSGGYPSSI